MLAGRSAPPRDLPEPSGRAFIPGYWQRQAEQKVCRLLSVTHPRFIMSFMGR